MNRPRSVSTPLETAAWTALIACIAIVPLSVAKLPFMDRPLTYASFAFPQTVTLLIGTAIALGAWGVAYAKRKASLMVSPWMAAVAALIGWAALATVTAYEPLRALFGKSTSSLGLTSIIGYAAVMFLTVQLARSSERMRSLTWTVVLSASAVAVIAVLQQVFNADLFGLPSLEAWFVSRGFSTIGNPDHLGTYLVLPLVLSASLAVFEPGARWRSTALGCSAVLATALTGSLSRGAWLGALSGLLLLAVLAWRNRGNVDLARRSGALLAVLVLAIAISLAASEPSDLGTRLSGPTSADTDGEPLQTVNAVSSDRINLWRSSLLIVADRPLTGTGPASYELGWYPRAIDPSSGGGTGGIADDPHSIIATLLATLGVPGLVAGLVSAVAALAIGVRTSLHLSREAELAGKALHYVSWSVATGALCVALLFAAVSTPIVLYLFLGMAVLLQPSAKTIGAQNGVFARLLPAAAAGTVAILLAVSVWPNLAAEVAVARTLWDGSLDSAREAVDSAFWNIDAQKAYYHLRVSRLDTLLDSGSPSAVPELEAIVDDLSGAGARQPREYYYPSVRAQVLTRASEVFADAGYAEAAVRAADDALAIMPASIPTRVNRALALSDLARYAEMAETLREYWRNELSSAYPGILYAQALALAGQPDEAQRVFTDLKVRFPDDTSIEDAQAQTEMLLQQP